jgi:hypothetical protein
MFRGSHKVALLLFLGVYFFSGLSAIGTSFDSRWTVYIAMSLWHHGVTNLDEYKGPLRESGFYGMECVDAQGHATPLRTDTCQGHWYNGYPIGGPVLTSPLIVVAVEVMHLLHPVIGRFHSSQPVIEGFLADDFDQAHPVIEMEVASALLAAAAVMMFSIGRMFLPVNRAVWLALLFALGTSAYSTAGRAIWQHTPSMLLLTIVIYLLLRAEQRPELAGWAGLPVALSYTVRPTDALFVMVFTAYVAWRHRRYLWKYLLAAAPVAAVFLGYNFSVYHALLSPYYHSDLSGFLPQYWSRWGVGLAGDLISPGRGLLAFTPVFLFAVWSMLRQKWNTPLAPWLTALAVAHWMAVAAYISNWWAGHCYGPRFFTDITPIFVLFLIPYLERWESLRSAARIAFVALAMVSVGIHLRGGWSLAVYRWNVDPANIDQHPERNWDWSDPQFLRFRISAANGRE